MYLNHYGLKEKPFQISTDPKFIWLGKFYKEALAVLEHGVLSNTGFLLVTGDVGTGKTTLVNALLNRLGDEILVANITNPVLEQLDFFNLIADELNMNKKFRSNYEFLFDFNKLLDDCSLQNKKVILIIDEAHRLNQDLLDQLQLLSNIQTSDRKVLNIFFVGQDEFNEIINQADNQALHQKIAVNFQLEPLKQTEIEEYILHRLNVAGRKDNFFNASAIHEIFSFSKGYPRLINIICDHALLTGYVIDTKTIDAKIIKECAPGLVMPTQEPTKNKKEPVMIPQRTNQKAITKSSGKRGKAFIVTALSLTMLGVLFYSGMDKKYLAKLTQYVKQYSNRPTELTSISVPQAEHPVNKRNLSVEKPQKIDTTRMSVTDPISNTENSSGQVENYGTPPQKSYIIPDPNASHTRNQKNHLNRIDELRKVWEVSSIPPPKTIINFDHNSNDLSDEDFKTLEPISSFISQRPNAKIIIKGYTDSYGKYLYNKRISKFRANLVKSYFVGRGISPSRIQTFGMGSENPIRSNQTREGRMMNRRVEINITSN